MLKKTLWGILIILILSLSGQAANYFVAPDGDDDNDGLAPGQAWLTVDNGDQKGLLVQGDTVNILAGT